MNKVILQDHAEFMQLYDIQKGHNDRVSTIVDQRIADAEARAGGGRGVGGGGATPSKKAGGAAAAPPTPGGRKAVEQEARIQVEKAQRRQATTDVVKRELQNDLDAQLRDYETPK